MTVRRFKKGVTHPQFGNLSGKDFIARGNWKEITGSSWLDRTGFPSAAIYAKHVIENRLPIDDKVFYGKLKSGNSSFGVFVHESELEDSNGSK